MKEFFSLEQTTNYFKESLLRLSEYTYVYLDAHPKIVQNVIRTLEGVEGDIVILSKDSLKRVVDLLTAIQEVE